MSQSNSSASLRSLRAVIFIMAATLLTPFLLESQTQVDASSQTRNLPVYSAKAFNVKGDGVTDDTAALKAALIAVNTRGGGYLFLPNGTYEISSEIVIPNGVQLVGLGWSSPPEWGQYGTVIQANSQFSGSATLPGNMMLAVDGASDTFGSGASNLTVDCNSIPGCGGLYRGHANEQTYFKRINVVNFSSYGLYICGAGENSDAPHVCGGNSNSGAQGDGPDEDLQFYPANAANANTLPIVIRSDLGYRGLHNVTIATLSTAPNQPNYGGWFSGSTYNVRNVHMEGPANGFYLGPLVGALCPKNCNGLNNAEFDEIDLTRGGTATIAFNAVANINLFNILGTITNNKFGQNIVSTDTVAFTTVDYAGNVISGDPTFGFSPAGPLTVNNRATIYSAIEPQLIIQNKTSPGFPFFGFDVTTDGSLILNGQGGTGNLLFTSPQSVFALGSGATLGGLNLQSPLVPATGSMRGTVCSNLAWSNANQNWSLASNGGSDYACVYFPGTGGFAVSASSTLAEPSSITETQFVANTHLLLTAAGNLMLGPNAASAADSGQALQVSGGLQLSGATQPACAVSIRGTFWFLPASAGAQDHVQVCAQGATGTLGWQQIY